jgi:hypothetical protein
MFRSLNVHQRRSGVSEGPESDPPGLNAAASIYGSLPPDAEIALTAAVTLYAAVNENCAYFFVSGEP